MQFKKIFEVAEVCVSFTSRHPRALIYALQKRFGKDPGALISPVTL